MVYSYKMLRVNKALVGGSLILLVTINLFNLLNLIFNVAMARMLSLADYGTLTLLTSFILVFSIFNESIQTIISKYSANENDFGKLKNIIYKSFRKAAKYSLPLFVTFLFASIFLSFIFSTSFYLIALVGFMILVVFFIPITRGALQGRKKFLSLGMNMTAEAFVKLIFAFLFVFLGMKVYGAVLGIILGSSAAFLLSLFNLKSIFAAKEKPSLTPEIYAYSKPVIITMLSIILFFTLDIFLAKFFFQPEIAGAYAIASTIAKIIFIGTQPISKAMFPFTAQINKGKESQKAFIHSFAFVAVLAAIALLLTWLFPSFIIRIYAGHEIILAASVLPYLAIAMTLLSIANLVLYYALSLGKLRLSYLMLIFVAIQAIALCIFHNNLFEFSIALITATAIFLWGAVLLLNAKN